ncbi:MAG: ArnT family glycosyltransferase [Pseudomonadota bacterium]
MNTTLGRARFVAYILISAFCAAWTICAGQDASWDFIHYHVYAGFSAIHDRISQDFFPAGPQSYFNPYVYVPAYWLTQTSLPTWAAAGLLALGQSVVGWIAFELSWALRMRDRDPSWARIGVATLLGLASPILLAQLGTGYADVTSGIFVLGAVWALVRGVADGRLRYAALAGLLVGAATVLKLSNAIFGLAIGISMLLTTSDGLRQGIRQAGTYGLAGALSAAVFGAPWALKLWAHFRNPVFPFLNSWFRSDAFPTDTAGKHMRFVPEGVVDALLRPLKMALPNSGIYVEAPLPDPRYAAVFLAVLVFLGVWAVRSRRSPEAAPFLIRRTPLLAATLVFLVSWALWLWTSGNGRYLAPMTILVGILAAQIWDRATAGRVRPYWYGIAALVLVHGVGLSLGSKLRWNSGPWGSKWLNIEVPAELTRTPYLYLGTDLSSASALAPWVHPASSFVHVNGQSPMALDGPGGRQLATLLQRYQGRIRMVGLMFDRPTPKTLKAAESGFQYRVARLGLRLDISDCEAVRLQVHENLKIESLSTEQRYNRNGEYYAACKVVPAPELRAKYEQEVKVPNRIFDDIERRCPGLFSPRRPVTEQVGSKTWWRYYVATDMRLMVADKEILYIDTYRLGPAITLGTVENWLAGKGSVHCGLRYVPIAAVYPHVNALGLTAPAASPASAGASPASQVSRKTSTQSEPKPAN